MEANATDRPPPAQAPVIAPAPADAVTELYRAHALGLIRLAVVMLGDRLAAEDAVQEAFCGLYRRWHSLADPAKALTYVRSSVINGCRTVLRRRRRQAGPDPSTGDPPGESAEALAVVHLTVSGASVATIRPSLPGGTMVAVTAAGDGRTFVLGEQGPFRKEVTFYQFRLGSSGRPALTRLPMSVADGKTMGDVALSPDGTRLAIAVAPGGGVQQVRLYPVGGGPARTWSATDGTSGGPFALGLLSWAANQRTLAFNWGPGQTLSARLLNLGNAGGSLLAASRPAVTLANTANMGQTLYQCGSLILVPNGSEFVCASGDITKIAKDGNTTYTTGFPEFSAATGHLTGILGHWHPNKWHEPLVVELLWSGASGRVLIGVIHAGGRNWVGVISGNKFTPLNARWALTTTQASLTSAPGEMST